MEASSEKSEIAGNLPGIAHHYRHAFGWDVEARGRIARGSTERSTRIVHLAARGPLEGLHTRRSRRRPVRRPCGCPPETRSVAVLDGTRALPSALIPGNPSGSVLPGRVPWPSGPIQPDDVDSRRDTLQRGLRRSTGGTVSHPVGELLLTLRRAFAIANDQEGVEQVVDLLTAMASADEADSARTRGDAAAMTFHIEVLNQQLQKLRSADFFAEDQHLR